MCHGASRTAEANDAHLLVGKFDEWRIPIAEVGVCGPAPCAVLAGIVVYALGDVEQVSHHHLCHRGGAIGGDVGDGDAVATGRLHIDYIVARGLHADIA